jgi:predicted GIY-YIG superfamily endonuclease
MVMGNRFKDVEKPAHHILKYAQQKQPLQLRWFRKHLMKTLALSQYDGVKYFFQRGM